MPGAGRGEQVPDQTRTPSTHGTDEAVPDLVPATVWSATVWSATPLIGPAPHPPPAIRHTKAPMPLDPGDDVPLLLHRHPTGVASSVR